MKARLLTLMLAMLAATTAMAQDQINQLVNTIVNNNPELMAQLNENDAAQRDLMDENALSNPEIGVTQVWGVQAEAGNKFQLDVSQGFDWPGLYRARSRVADGKLELANCEFAAARLDKAMEAKQLLIDLVGARQRCELQGLILSDYQDLRKAMDLAYENGLVTILDRKKLDIEIYKLESALAQTEHEVSGIEAQIRAMAPTITLDLTEVTSFPIERVLSDEEYEEEALTNDPSLQASHLQESTSALEAKAARLSRFPGFSLGYEYQHEAGLSYNGFTAGITLPIFENRNAKAAAILRAQAANGQSVAIASELRLRTSENLSQARMWRGHIEAYKRAMGGNEYITLLERALKGGEISVLQYLEEMQYYREASLEYISAQYNYATTLASLNRYTLLLPLD